MSSSPSQTTLGALKKLPPPVCVKVTDNSVELNWAPGVETRLVFTVEQKDCSDSSAAGITTVYHGYAKYYHITGLKDQRKYQYWVKATNDVGPGPWSEPLTVVTQPLPPPSKNLHKAIQQGNAELVSSILRSNSNTIDIPNIMGFSPLMKACALGNTDIVNVLLDRGANLEFQNCSGRTCLMEACYNGHVECAEILLKHGCSCLTRDKSGFSALHYAVDGGNIDMVNFILNTEEVPVDDVASSTLSGWSPLMRLAALGGDPAVARVLVERGADVNRRDKEGNTVLMVASLKGFDVLVKVLLECGADPHVKTEHGKKALDFAVTFRRESVVDELTKVMCKENGSSWTAENGEGQHVNC